MLLKEFMASAKPDVIYHIGSGTSFICVVNTDEFEEDIKIWDKRIRDVHARHLAEAFNTASNKGPQKETFRDDNVIMYYALTQDVHEHDAIKSKATKKFQDALKKIEDYVPLWDREVKEDYDRKLKDGRVVIIEGDEDGKFWDRSEYLVWASNKVATEGEQR